MKVAVICANGKEGKLIVKEAAERGLDVTAVVRGDNATAAKKVLKKDLFDLTDADVKDFTETSVRHSLRYRYPAAHCRRSGKPVCESGTYCVRF